MLLKVGNGIPCALAAVLGIDFVVGKVTAAGQADGYKPPGGVRSYREVSALVGCTLSPAATWTKDMATGSWLVHTFCAGRPHCFLLVWEGGTVQVANTWVVFTVGKEDMLGYLEKALDKNFLFFFRVNGPEASVSLLPLLDLQA